MTEPTATPAAGDERVVELEQQMEELRGALDVLRASLAGEIRTREEVRQAWAEFIEEAAELAQQALYAGYKSAPREVPA